MNRLLIISKEQFGYHTDIYKWCKHLKNDYCIKVVCFGGKQRKHIENVKVCYVPHIGNRIIKGFLYIIVSLFHIYFNKGITIVCNFKGCGIFKKVFPSKRMILDIRTLGVIRDKELRAKEDEDTQKTAELYDFTTIISKGTRDKLKLDNEKSAILPLGADIMSKKNKSFDSLRLLYVGTLQDRDIDKTIKGISLLLKKHPDIDIKYDIIGGGFNNEVNNFKELTKDLGLENIVTLHGYMHHDELQSFYDNCNIGVSFIPITEFYDHQPATKTYEYILSGMYTIATETFSNKQIISKDNGYLIKDTPESFAEGIEYIIYNLNTLDSDSIRNTLTDSQWKNIVKEIMLPILRYFEKNPINKELCQK